VASAAKILIADDEPECIEFVREALADSPYEVLGAGDGEEALTVAREHKPQLIILDIQMPKLNGFEVFARLKQDPDLAAVPVVMLTGVAEKTGIGFSSSAMGEYLGKEPDAYIEKPIEPVVLKQTVGRLLR
jgi:two-component system alkaline phosphatase synthesis response regulator PhoP